MKRQDVEWQNYSIVAVIPCYRVESEIRSIISNLPRLFKYVIVVDDASPDETARIVMEFAEKDRRIILLQHKKNLGVGGAMKSGFQKALELGTQVVVKIDGDGQMNMDYLPDLLLPLINGRADYTKAWDSCTNWNCHVANPVCNSGYPIPYSRNRNRSPFRT